MPRKKTMRAALLALTACALGALWAPAAYATDPLDTVLVWGPEATEDLTPIFEFRAVGGPGGTPRFYCAIDAGLFQDCASPFETQQLQPGEHTFQATSSVPGALDITPLRFHFTIMPTTSVSHGPGSYTNDTTPWFAFSSTGSGNTYQCKLDTGNWLACDARHTTWPLADGTHVLRVSAIGPTGVIDPTPAVYSFTVDTRAPETQILSGGGWSLDPTRTFTFSGTDDSAPHPVFACAVDSGAWRPCQSPYVAPAQQPGMHIFYVKAVDAANNVDPTPAERVYFVGTPTG